MLSQSFFKKLEYPVSVLNAHQGGTRSCRYKMQTKFVKFSSVFYRTTVCIHIYKFSFLAFNLCHRVACLCSILIRLLKHPAGLLHSLSLIEVLDMQVTEQRENRTKDVYILAKTLIISYMHIHICWFDSHHTGPFASSSQTAFYRRRHIKSAG